MVAKPVSPYRRLQLRCKAAGLPANKSAAELTRFLAEAGAENPNLQAETDVTAAAKNDATIAPASLATEAYVDEVTRLWPEGFAGISAKGLFRVLPGWVNKKLAPGTTSQASPTPNYMLESSMIAMIAMIACPGCTGHWLGITVRPRGHVARLLPCQREGRACPQVMVDETTHTKGSTNLFIF